MNLGPLGSPGLDHWWDLERLGDNFSVDVEMVPLLSCQINGWFKFDSVLLTTIFRLSNTSFVQRRILIILFSLKAAISNLYKHLIFPQLPSVGWQF